MKRVWIFCDGSTGTPEKGNGDSGATATPVPVGCGAGAVALDANGRIVGWEWRSLPAMTSNEAEYAGLLLGIALANRLAADETVFLLDSDIVVGQITGRYAVNSRALHRWYWQACAALRTLPSARFCVIPREWNRLADGLAWQATIWWPWLKREVERELEKG